MSELLHFLTDFAVDPKGQEVFAKSPEAVLGGVKLSEASKAALQDGARVEVTSAFANELEINDLAAVMGSCTYTDPGPDPNPDPDPPEPPSE